MLVFSSLLNSIPLFATKNLYPRRLLLIHAPIYKLPVGGSPVATEAPPPVSSIHNSSSSESSFDSNVIMILAVLLCALICALGLNSIVRCALRCSTRMTLDPFSSARHNTGGVKKKALKSLPTLTYSEGLKLPGTSSECTICLSDFSTGERVRVLPKCNHGFHVQCIDRWLAAHSSCPTCRRCLPTDLKKTAACTTMALSPLDPEDPLFNYRGQY